MRRQFRTQYRRWKLFLRKKRFHRKINLGENEWMFIFSYGIGDFYLFLTLVEAFRKYNKADRISIGLSKSSHKQLLPIFGLDFFRIIDIRNDELEFCTSNIFKPGIPIHLHPYHFMQNTTLSIIGYNGLTLVDTYKFLLNIPINETIVQPDISIKPYVNYEIGDSFFHFDKKVALICPNANSFKDNFFTIDFWESLVLKLQDIGYNVLVNTLNKNDYSHINGINLVDFRLDEAISFVNECDICVAVRSGFCDLISTSSTKKIILYPKMQWYSGSLKDGSSLVSMGLAKTDIFEIEISAEFLIDGIEKILEYITNE